MPSSTTNRILVALKLIEEDFGDIVKDVAKFIFECEDSTFQAIVRHFAAPSMVATRGSLPMSANNHTNPRSARGGSKKKHLNVQQIQDALLILLTHNFLLLELPALVDEEEEISLADRLSQSGLIYSLDFDMILNRLRLPRAILQAKKKYGVIGIYIVEQLFSHGRLRIDKIRTDVCNRLQSELSLSIAGSADELLTEDFEEFVDMNEGDLHARIAEVFQSMVYNRLVVNVPNQVVSRRAVIKESKAAGQILESMKHGGIVTAATRNNKRKIDASFSSAPVQEVVYDLPLEMRLMEMQATAAATAAAQIKSESEEMYEQPRKMQATAVPAVGLGPAGRGRGRGGRGGRGAAASLPASSSSSSSAFVAAVDNTVVLDYDGRGNIHNNYNTYSCSISNSNNNNNNNGNSNSSSSAAEIPAGVQWMIGWHQVLRQERHDLIISVTRDRMEAKAALAVATILEASMSTENGFRTPHSAHMTLQKIYDNMNAASSAAAATATATGGAVTAKVIDLNTLRKLMELLRNDPMGFVSKTPPHQMQQQLQGNDAESTSYFVNMNAIVQFCKKKIIHSIAVNRYGVYSGRIVELLLRKGYLEQQQIGDMTIMPAREARERLYQLYRDKWVNYYELSKRSDYQPQATFYFWHLEQDKLEESMLETLYKTMLNIKLRYDSEIESNRTTLDISSGLLNTAAKGSSDVASSLGNVGIGRLDQALERLDRSILYLDETIMRISKF